MAPGLELEAGHKKDHMNRFAAYSMDRSCCRGAMVRTELKESGWRQSGCQLLQHRQ